MLEYPDWFAGHVVEDADQKKQKLLVNYQEHVHNNFNKYAFCFFLCELVNIAILVIQVLATNSFLEYRFLDYGYKVYKYYRLPLEERKHFKKMVDPMCDAFPKGTTLQNTISGSWLLLIHTFYSLC